INNIDIFVGKVFSINDIIKEINQALHGNDTAYYTIPQARKTVAQELFLFENSGSDDFERIVDSQFQKTRITIKTPWVDAIICNNFIEDIKNRFNDVLQDKADITITGGMALMSRVIMAAIYSMARSYVIAFLVITLMMILFIGDIKIGLISMIPNLLPILIIMGIMGFAKVPLTMNTLLIGSIAMGLVVDDTVHFIHNFQRYYKETEDAHEAIKETLLSTGRALLITSLVLATGFFVLMFATLNHLVRFGFFTGMAILIALLADFLLAPALMILVTRRNKSSRKVAKS
ncbi:MMPL family transporter, partial [Candidatus Pacearchaeota archaeon]|nr:MMPL family transporter [Candidatus Pacearchaeota archaeon]